MTVLGDVLMLLGAALVAIAAVGAHRFRDTLARLHAGGKATSFGILVLLLGAGLRSADAAVALELATTAVLLIVTMPLATHVLVRSVLRRHSAEEEAQR